MTGIEEQTNTPPLQAVAKVSKGIFHSPQIGILLQDHGEAELLQLSSHRGGVIDRVFQGPGTVRTVADDESDAPLRSCLCKRC